MKITKEEREVIREIQSVSLKACSERGHLLMSSDPEVLYKQLYAIDLALSRWHLAKLKEARADGYMDAVTKKGSNNLVKILAIIDSIETRAMAADGPVTNTREEMTDEELRKIYRLAGGKLWNPCCQSGNTTKKGHK